MKHLWLSVILLSGCACNTKIVKVYEYPEGIAIEYKACKRKWVKTLTWEQLRTERALLR